MDVKNLLNAAAIVACLLFFNLTFGQTPEMIHYQGRVTVNDQPFTGTGSFKFAIVTPASGQNMKTVWANDNHLGTEGVPEPTEAVSVTAKNGVFAIALGDNTLAGMASLSPIVFRQHPLFLRIWFDDGAGSFEQLTPDQPILSVPYALQIPEESISQAHIKKTSFAFGASNNSATGHQSFVGGGLGNDAEGDTSFVGGGGLNVAEGISSFVGGGTQNVAEGIRSAVIGGQKNKANGENSLAAGRQATAQHDGSFVWADHKNRSFSSTKANQFLISADGGVGINTNNPKGALHVNGNVVVGDLSGVESRLGVGTSNPWNALHVVSPPDESPVRVSIGNSNQANTAFRIYPNRGVAIGYSWGENQIPEGGLRVSGATEIDENLTVSGTASLKERLFVTGFTRIYGDVRLEKDLRVGGTARKSGGGLWSTLSDRRLKKNIEPVEPGMLDRLLELKSYTYQYNDDLVESGLELPGTQIGMIAQEVAEVFPDWVEQGEDGYLMLSERGITAIFTAAIRELREESSQAVGELEEENQSLRREIAELREQMSDAAEETQETNTRLARIEALLDAEPLAAR